jgi:predicted amidohydrolase
VTVINPGNSSVEPDRAVTIDGDHTTAVSDSANFQSPSHAQTIDGTGQFLIPGLWDMHVHAAFGDWFPGGRDIILPLFVANGVTGIRDMGGDIPDIRIRISESRHQKHVELRGWHERSKVYPRKRSCEEGEAAYQGL